MAANNKHSYEDWWNGKICLVYAPIFYNKVNNDIPSIVSWDQIKQSDAPKIKAKQKNIFQSAVSKLLKVWVDDFTSRFKNSKVTGLLLNRELMKFEDIMFGPIPSNNNILLYAEIPISIYSLSVIKKFIDDTKVKGSALEFDFIHSPNCIFQNKTEIPAEIYAECCWLYLKWLQKFLKPIKHKSKTQNPAAKKSAGQLGNNEAIIVENLPDNPYPDIFKNGYAFNMFLELQSLTVNKKTIVADYSFIFHKMQNQRLNALNQNVTQHIFINFLNTNYNTEIEVKKLPFRDPLKKQATFATIINKYKKDILSN